VKTRKILKTELSTGNFSGRIPTKDKIVLGNFLGVGVAEEFVVMNFLRGWYNLYGSSWKISGHI